MKNDNLLDLLKKDMELSFIRFKYILKDKHIRWFILILVLSVLASIAAIKFLNHFEPIAKFFLACGFSAFIMVILRDIYILWFLDIEEITGRKSVNEVSFRSLYNEAVKNSKLCDSEKAVRFKAKIQEGKILLNSIPFYEKFKNIDNWFLYWILIVIVSLILDV